MNNFGIKLELLKYILSIQIYFLLNTHKNKALKILNF
jgi:hypothetical protein